MSTHDPMCWTQGAPGFATEDCLPCQIVRNVRANERAKYVNVNCVWGEGECIPNCPTCHDLDALYAERVAGAMEERAANHRAVKRISRYDLQHGRMVQHDSTGPYVVLSDVLAAIDKE